MHELVDEPLLLDRVQLLEDPTRHSHLMVATVSRTASEYHRSARRLVQTLRSIINGPMGVIFNGPKTA